MFANLAVIINNIFCNISVHKQGFGLSHQLSHSFYIKRIAGALAGLIQ